jgi:hypothetical protein
MGRQRYRNLRKLSGYNYVPSVLKQDGAWYQLEIKWLSYHCDHQNTVCPTTKCVRSWMQDYQLWFYRTAGGRRLAKAVGIDPNVAQPDIVGNVAA